MTSPNSKTGGEREGASTPHRVQLRPSAHPEDYTRLAAALRVMAASEMAQARKVQGPSFVGSQWGADIIDAHIARADILSDAAEALVQAGRDLIVAISQTCGDA